MGLYTITTRADGTVLTATIFNADHQNHVTHTAAGSPNDSINSDETATSTTTALQQMQIETNPNPAGNPSLAASLAGEFERLRSMLTTLKKFIAGSAPSNWYVALSSFSSGVHFPAAACRLEQSIAQPILNGTSLTPVSFDKVQYDTLGTMADPSDVGIKVPVTGNYLIGGSAGFGDGLLAGLQVPSGNLQLALRVLVGAFAVSVASNQVFSSGSFPKSCSVETIARLTAGQVLQLTVSQTSGVTQSLSLSPVRPALWAALVGS
jgi:hypothetical protein